MNLLNKWRSHITTNNGAKQFSRHISISSHKTAVAVFVFRTHHTNKTNFQHNKQPQPVGTRLGNVAAISVDQRNVYPTVHWFREKLQQVGLCIYASSYCVSYALGVVCRQKIIILLRTTHKASDGSRCDDICNSGSKYQ